MINIYQFTRPIVIVFILFVFVVQSLFSQVSDPGITASLPPEKLDEYKEESKQLVSFVEFMFNTLGRAGTSPKDKETIITDSYLKAFRDGEVQIEDDLVEDRAVVTNKDVQAYLKDIDFFFKDIQFDFIIEEVNYNINEYNQIFFTVKTSRNLSGNTLSNEPVNRNLERYFEINLDEENRDLKIVSIYTTKLSLEEDLKIWWNELPFEWKYLFGDDIQVSNSLTMRDILQMDSDAFIGDTIVVRNVSEFYSSDSGLVGDLSMLDPKSRVYTPRVIDTLILNQTSIFDHLKKLISLETLDLSEHLLLSDLSGLSKMTSLRNLNISNTQVNSLVPLRNLTKLESLNFSNTNVNSIDPLRYALELKVIICDQTPLRDVKTLQYFNNLEKLSINKTKVIDISPLSYNKSLVELSLDETPIMDLQALEVLENLTSISLANTRIFDIQALESLKNLQRVNLEYTPVSNVTALSNAESLQFLFCDWSQLTSIAPLRKLPEIKRIYCDNTKVSPQEAITFMQERPEVLVIYESAILQKWWSRLPDYWRSVFAQYTEISAEPNREELHEIINITEIDINKHEQITSLDPLSSLINLKKLNCDYTKIYSLEPLRYLLNLEEISFAYSQVQNLVPLEGLGNLSKLNGEHTLIEDLSPLKNAKNLTWLNVDETKIADLSMLQALENLEIIFADGTQLNLEKVRNFQSEAMVIFQTPILNSWWNSLSNDWQNIFSEYVSLSEIPTREELHQVVNLNRIEIKGENNITNLTPLQYMITLKELSIESTAINDLGPLSTISQLESLRCVRNPITNLEPLSNLIRLQSLNIENTRVEDLTPLESLIRLKSIRCAGTQVTDLGALEYLNELQILDISNTDVKKLNDIEGLSSLEQLLCFNTRISSGKIEKFKSNHPNVEVVYY